MPLNTVIVRSKRRPGAAIVLFHSTQKQMWNQLSFVQFQLDSHREIHDRQDSIALFLRQYQEPLQM